MKATSRLHFCFSESSNWIYHNFAILFFNFFNYNLHTIQFTCFTCTIQLYVYMYITKYNIYLVYVESCITVTSGVEIFLFFGHLACGILVPPPRIKPVSPALEVWSLNCWTAREKFRKFLNFTILSKESLRFWGAAIYLSEDNTVILVWHRQLCTSRSAVVFFKRILFLPKRSLNSDVTKQRRDLNWPLA